MYKHILVAVELNTKEDKIIMTKADEVAQLCDGVIFLVHSIQFLNDFALASAGMALVDLENKIREDHIDKLKKLADTHNIPESRIILGMSPVTETVAHAAKHIKADVIITGNHGRHGLDLLFGSKMDSIMHNTKCDILAVHLPAKK